MNIGTPTRDKHTRKSRWGTRCGSRSAPYSSRQSPLSRCWSPRSCRCAAQRRCKVTRWSTTVRPCSAPGRHRRHSRRPSRTTHIPTPSQTTHSCTPLHSGVVSHKPTGFGRTRTQHQQHNSLQPSSTQSGSRPLIKIKRVSNVICFPFFRSPFPPDGSAGLARVFSLTCRLATSRPVALCLSCSAT